MTTETMQPTTDLHFPLLTEAAYLAAVQKAETTIRDRISVPTMDRFVRNSQSTYPRPFKIGVLVALAAVLLFSFWVSAGKQIASASMLFDGLPGQFSRLSPLWSGVSIVSMLAVSEIGVVLFLVAAGTLSHGGVTWKGINLIAWLLRFFAGLCGLYAVVANVSITLIAPVAAVGVLQWLESIGIPITVLGLGIIIERMAVESIETGAAQKIAYNTAVSEYEAVQADPTKHTSWAAVLSDCLWSTLNLRHKETLAAYVERDARYRRWIVQSEYAAHQETAALVLEDGNPFLLPAGNLPGSL